MKISHEVPKCLLGTLKEYQDYSYCLPHLLDEDEEYKDFFLKEKENGRYIVMDNSLHELGEAYDHKRLLYWVGKLEPDEFMVPDVWENPHQTIKNAKYWKQYEYPEDTTLVAVVQAQSIHEANICYRTLKDLGYQKVAFSYGAKYYEDIVPHPNKDYAKALGRINLISQLYKMGTINSNDRVHLLGCALPQEFGWYKDFNFIESIDTSNPIMAALDDVMYKENGLLSKPISNMNNNFNIKMSEIDYLKVIHNMEMFRKINNI